MQFKNINNTLSEQKKNTNITDVIYDTIIDSINKISSKIANQVNKIKNIKHNGKTITLIQQNTLENNKKIKINDYDKIIKEVLNEIFFVKDKEKKQNKNQQEDIDTTQLIDKNDDNDSNISDKKEKKTAKKIVLLKAMISMKKIYI